MIEVRQIKVTDYPQVSEMIPKVIRQSFKELYKSELIEEFCKKYEVEKFKIKAKEIEYTLAFDGSTIIGIIGRKENQLRSFFVLPEWQGKGVGRKLFDAFEKAVRNDGFHKIILESSPLGQPIYEHFGFEKIGSRVKERIGIKYTDAIMGKELN